MLAERQAHIARSAKAYVARYGEAPSMRELAAAAGLSSVSTVAYHLRCMREQGYPVDTRGRVSTRCSHCGQ
ncbi:LexA family protein [Streptomyces monticola]|uniref:LexA family protein n=1 Tax=Streptomyces monticola TaxID=2666263 RepID=A0ABW2JT40_9ACTN